VLHHLLLWVPDLDRAAMSWSWLLSELGYDLERSDERLLLFRHPSRFAVVLEQSPDMVPGMLYSRLRPGLNHLAFAVDAAAVQRVMAGAEEHGWTVMPGDRHPIAGAADVIYLEDADGFEVEVVELS
jgi:catechol 2,3-dioxygenase-like lactoylglutathione lyase family enzyme